MEERFATFSSLLVNISRCVQRIKNQEMAALGLKGRQTQCLFTLHVMGGVSLVRLGKLCGEDKGMMSRTVKELEARGLVYLERMEGRKYGNPIRLTEEGERVAEVVSERVAELLEQGGSGLSDGARQELYRSLGIVSDNLTKICRQYET